MKKKIKIVSFILIFISISIRLYLYLSVAYNISVQNRIIDEVFNYDVSDSTEIVRDSNSFNDYLGYVSIPKFDINCVIKYGTDDSVLNSGFVGIHKLSGSLDSNDMIILAGHNVSNVFNKLHYVLYGDLIFINSYDFSRKFVVYDKKVINEYEIDYLLENRNKELLLITCTKIKGERLIVFLKEVL